MKLPDHLRRKTFILEPDMDVSGLQKIGEEVTEVLEFTPGEFFVNQYIRPKYAAPLPDGTSTVITASLPGRLLEKDRKSTRLNSSHVKISYAVFCLKKKTV